MVATANPHHNPLRNLRKKLEAVLALQKRDESELDDAQKAKLKTSKKLTAEVAALEKKYTEWEAANGDAAEKEEEKAAPKPQAKKGKAQEKKAEPAAAPAASEPSTEDLNKLRNLTKKLKSIEELEAKIKAGFTPDQAQKDKVASKKAVTAQIAALGKTTKQAAPKAAGEQQAKEKGNEKENGKEKPKGKKEAAEETPANELDAKTEKTMRNRIKNLKAKLESIKELKSRPAADLDADQQAKIKTDKKIRKEHDELVQKLAAFGKTV